ncbi:MAG TPA: F0F1 ATP synthase subunit B [Candidatus Angelobacter sp.]|nr:F0F1 ATP synthase subunit B [Candidatus Angelobacter sp.]
MNHMVLFGSIGSDLSDIGTSTAHTFGVDWPHFIAQVISFCITAALLYFFAYKRVLAMLEERRQRIADGLANADKIKAELQRTEAARLEVLNQANTQANKLIEEARAAANRVREDETQKAIAAAEQIITKAREAAAADHARMLADLKREVGRLVVQTTATVTGKVLTPEDQKRLAEETAKQLA